ncbi:MAG: 2-C-methyl-D-erythritol 4-phosphate cytidylyltransferase [Defluviitaleaceae bacterium]|nr:2-C-methyl-D-erythritol 4-phosphate cytidylyltransferase [Defluviitaleaceae bacterium]
MKTAVIIPAAGTSSRMGGVDKVTLLLNGKPIFEYILDIFVNHENIAEIVVATTPKIVSILEENEKVKHLREKFSQKSIKFILGKETRQASVYAGLQAVDESVQCVLVHDMARPLVSKKIIDDILGYVELGKCAVSGVPSKDTVKVVDSNNKVVETPNRENLWLVHTPQGFPAAVLRQAHERALSDNFLGTDDASLVERLNVAVYMVFGDYGNVKVTTKEDIAVAEKFLEKV